jgi:hypothetical protein
MSLTDLWLVRTSSTVCALNSGVKERLERAVIMDILPALSPTHQECPPNRVKTSNRYTVDQALVGRRVELRFDLEDLDQAACRRGQRTLRGLCVDVPHIRCAARSACDVEGRLR